MNISDKQIDSLRQKLLAGIKEIENEAAFNGEWRHIVESAIDNHGTANKGIDAADYIADFFRDILHDHIKGKK